MILEPEGTGMTDTIEELRRQGVDVFAKSEFVAGLEPTPVVAGRAHKAAVGYGHKQPWPTQNTWEVPTAGEVEANIRAWPGPRWQGVVMAEVLLARRSVDAGLDAITQILDRCNSHNYSELVIKKGRLTANDLLDRQAEKDKAASNKAFNTAMSSAGAHRKAAGAHMSKREAEHKARLAQLKARIDAESAEAQARAIADHADSGLVKYVKAFNESNKT